MPDSIGDEEKHIKDLGGIMKKQIMIVDDDMTIGNMLESSSSKGDGYGAFFMSENQMIQESSKVTMMMVLLSG